MSAVVLVQDIFIMTKVVASNLTEGDVLEGGGGGETEQQLL